MILTKHAKNISGKTFHYLIVLEPSFKKDGIIWWKVKCKCGNIKDVPGAGLRNGSTKSCGCYNIETKETHKLMKIPLHIKKHPLANIWRNIISRCLISTSKNYHNYGGRGITICERWMQFENFIIDVTERPSLEYTLDRMNNSGNYEPGNVKWSTSSEQKCNTRRTHYITFDGKTQALSLWAKEKNLCWETLSCRIKANWPLDKALNTPSRRK